MVRDSSLIHQSRQHSGEFIHQPLVRLFSSSSGSQTQSHTRSLKAWSQWSVGALCLFSDVTTLTLSPDGTNHILSGRPRQDDQFWIKQPGTMSKAASSAGPPSWVVSNSVSGLTQQFEQLSVKRSSSESASTGLMPEHTSSSGGLRHPVALIHDEISMEPYSGNAFAHVELAPSSSELLVCSSICRLWACPSIGV